MDLIVDPRGHVRAIYGEAIDLRALGRPAVARASQVEPDAEGRWLADLGPVGGPVLGPFDLRSEALEAEVAWLGANWLMPRAEPGLPSSPSRTPRHHPAAGRGPPGVRARPGRGPRSQKESAP